MDIESPCSTLIVIQAQIKHLSKLLLTAISGSGFHSSKVLNPEKKGIVKNVKTGYEQGAKTYV